MQPFTTEEQRSAVIKWPLTEHAGLHQYPFEDHYLKRQQSSLVNLLGPARAGKAVGGGLGVRNGSEGTLGVGGSSNNGTCQILSSLFAAPMSLSLLGHEADRACSGVRRAIAEWEAYGSESEYKSSFLLKLSDLSFTYLAQLHQWGRGRGWN